MGRQLPGARGGGGVPRKQSGVVQARYITRRTREHLDYWRKKGGAPVTGDTVKTSAGAIFKIPICKVDHIKDAIFYLKASNINTVSATEKTDKSVYDLDLNQPLAIIMGSEGKGVSKSVLNIVDHKASLPLLGDVNSLNVSVACGAFLYEAIRQRSL